MSISVPNTGESLGIADAGPDSSRAVSGLADGHVRSTRSGVGGILNTFRASRALNRLAIPAALTTAVAVACADTGQEQVQADPFAEVKIFAGNVGVENDGVYIPVGDVSGEVTVRVPSINVTRTVKLTGKENSGFLFLPIAAHGRDLRLEDLFVVLNGREMPLPSLFTNLADPNSPNDPEEEDES